MIQTFGQFKNEIVLDQKSKAIFYGNFLAKLKRYKVILKTIKNGSKFKMKRIEERR